MLNQKALDYHYKLKGKYEIASRTGKMDSEILSLAYTPGVASPCLEIQRDPALAYQLTRKWNTVAVISDGSAVLGLGNIGGLAGLPVMEGKAVLFHEFAGIDAIPIVLSTQDTDEIVQTVKNMAATFGGINLEDISAPRCFEVEERLKRELDIPVFHDDQHGTAIVVLASLLNALRLTGKAREKIRVVVNGAGAAGTAITRLLMRYGVTDIVMNDKDGILDEDNAALDDKKREMATLTNPRRVRGGLKEAVAGADVFVGVSVAGALTQDMVRTMAIDPIIFAMANPEPEIYPEQALAAGAAVVGTGRSDFPNQINNVLVFPGIFRGALDARSSAITEEMKLAAGEAIAALVADSELNAQYILPKPFDPRVTEAVARAVREKAEKGGGKTE